MTSSLEPIRSSLSNGIHRLLLRTAIETAVEDAIITRSPVRGIKLPATKTAEKRFLAHTEVMELADAISPRHRALVLAACYTGMRFGELAALRLENLNLLKAFATVVETASEVSGRIIIGPPKTASSRRQISLPQFLVHELSEHLRQHGPGNEGLVFSAPRGGPLRRTLFRRRVWLPAVDQSVGQPCRFHDLRHTHAALLIAEGTHPKVIQERLGHASIRTTLDTYGHLFEGLDEAAADSLDAAIAKAGVGLSWG